MGAVASRVVGVVVISAACGCTPQPPVGSAHQALGAPLALQLLLDGVTVQKGASDNYYSKTSQLAAATSPAFDPMYTTPHLDATTAKAALLRRVASYFARYSGFVQTTVIGETDADWIVVGGAPDDLVPAAPSGAAGIAPLDCGDAQVQNGGWVFSDTLPINYGGLLAVATTVAHEVGHLRGLEHTQSPTDLMYAATVPTQTIEDLFAAAFGAGAASDDIADVGFRCSNDATIDNHQRLLDRLGAASPPAPAPPTLTWTGPSSDFYTGGSITLDATADDATAILEVWRGFELYAVLPTPPPWHVALPVDYSLSGSFVTLDAWVGTQHSHETRHFHFLPTDDLGPPPDLGGVDLATTPDLATPDLGGHDHDSGCRVGAAAPLDWSSCLIIWSSILFIATRSYRRSVRG